MLELRVMRPVDALSFGVRLGLRSSSGGGIVDIGIVTGSIARHAWIPPQRTALAGRQWERGVSELVDGVESREERSMIVWDDCEF